MCASMLSGLSGLSGVSGVSGVNGVSGVSMLSVDSAADKPSYALVWRECPVQASSSAARGR